MERKLKQKTFSDVLEEAIRQRWGTKRKTSLLNFPRNAKKYKVQSLGFSTSQQHSQTTIADQESFCQSQPIISEKKLSYCPKQAVRGWKPPLKRFQEIKDRINAADVNSIASSKLPGNKAECEGSMDDNNLQENFSQTNLVHSEAKSGSEKVLDEYVVHEGNSELSNTIKISKAENKESLRCTLLALKDDAGSVHQDTSQTSNFHCVKSRCSFANINSVAQENASDCMQNSVIDKEADLENRTLPDQVSNERSGYEMTTPAVNGSKSSSKMIGNIASLEETLSKTNTEADLKSDDLFRLSQQRTQPYFLNDNITHAENTIIVQEEIEKPYNCEVLLLSPKAKISPNPSYPTVDTPNVAMNAPYIVGAAVNEDTKEDFPLSSAESTHNDNVTTAMGEKSVPGKDTLVSKGFKEIVKEEPSRSGVFSPIISKSKMAQIQQNGLVWKQNYDICISENGTSNAKMNHTDEKKITGGDISGSGETIVITYSRNPMQENIDKEYEKGFSLPIKCGSTEAIGPKSCDEISIHTDARISAGKYDENKTLLFDAKRCTVGIEEKFRNVFHCDNYVEGTPGKENNPVFDNNEEPPIKATKTAPKQDMQMKTSENYHACIAAIKLSEHSNAYQKSPAVSFIEETKKRESKDDISISSVACDGFPLSESTCKSSEYALKCTGHTAKESYNKEIAKDNCSKVVLPVETESLPVNQSTLKFDDEDQNVKGPNNIQSPEIKEHAPLVAAERSNAIVSDETKPLAENSNTEEKNDSKYQEALVVINTASSESAVRNNSKIHSEDIIISQSNGNEFVFEKETLAENNSEEKFIKKAKPSSTDLTNQISTPHVEVKNDSEILNNFKAKQFHYKNETGKETGDLIINNEEPDHTKSKIRKQPENKCAAFIPDITNDEAATKNKNDDLSEMEDDFGLTVSQILRIEDECKQKMFIPEMLPLQWAQKVKESRRKIQAVIQEITMLNAMLKKVRKEIWLPQSNANTEESTSAAEDFNTIPRPASYRWNRNLNFL